MTLTQILREKIQGLREQVWEEPENVVHRLALSDALCQFAVECLESAEIRRPFLEEAKTHLEMAQHYDPGAPGILLCLGQVHFHCGEHNAARGWLESIKPTDPSYSLARFTLAEIWLAEGCPAQVKMEMERLRNRDLPWALREAVDYWCIEKKAIEA